MNKATKAYWSQVHAIERMTGASSSVARRAVSIIRETRDWSSAKATKEHPIVVQRIVDQVERQQERDRRDDRDVDGDRVKGKSYRDLDEWISVWEQWEGDYEYFEVETNADY